jgi:hypothetical protein
MRFKTTDTTDSFGQRPAVRLVVIALLFAGAFAVRLYRIDQPLLGFHPIRQYRTAILAQTYYYKNVESIPQWKKQLHAAYKNRIPLLEPPIGEIVTAGIWRIAGGEYLWLPRIVSCVYWLAGGMFLYLVACRLISPGAAFFSILFYLFWPYNIFIGRSIQPEAMLVMLYLCSVFLMLRYYDRPTVTRLILVAMAAGCAILIKPYVIFPIYAAFISLGIFKQGLTGFVMSPKSILFVIISLLPGGVYYGHSFLASEYLGRRSQMQFVPTLLLTGRFWKGWLTMIGRTTGILALIAAVIGTFFCRKGSARVFLAGLWVGYLVFGLVFNYAIHTHDYYQLPLVPIVSIGLGPIGVALINSLRRLSMAWRGSLSAVGILFLVILGGMALKIRPDQFFNMNPELKDKLEVACNFIGVNPHDVKRINADFASEAKTVAEIGEIVNHSTKTFFLVGREIRALMYHGQICGIALPSSRRLEAQKLQGRPGDSLRSFKGKYHRHSPEFLIVTDLEDFDRQKELKDFLTSRFPVFAGSDKYLIFDLTAKGNSHEGDN